MTDEHPASQVAAAWYPDPTSPEHYRWWDGTAWTPHQREREAAPAPYVPMQYESTPIVPASVASTVRPGGPVTLAMLVFSLLPLGIVVVPGIVAALAPASDELEVQLAIVVATIVASVVVAVWDGRALLAHGYASYSLPHPVFAVVPVGYIIRRMFAIGGLTYVFLIIWCGTTLAGYVSQSTDLTDVVVPSTTSTTDPRLEAPYTAANRAYVLSPIGMAQLVSHQIDSKGPVVCAPLASLEPGAHTDCTATLPLGIEVVVTVEVQPNSPNTTPVAVIGTVPKK